MGETLNPGDGRERQLGDDAAVEDGIEHGEERGEGEANSEHGLHLDQHKVSVGIFKSLLVTFHLALLRAIEGGITVGFLLALQSLRLLLDVQLQALILFGPVNQEPGETLAQQRRAHGDRQDEQCVRPHPQR